MAATSRVGTVLLSSVLIAGLAAGEAFAAATPDVGRPAPPGARRLVVRPAQATPDAPSKSAATAQLVFDGLGPLAWNATVNRNKSTGVGLPSWAALRVLGPSGSESLFVFPPRSPAYLVASWPRQDLASHTVRIFPGYRWIVVETPAESAAVTTAALMKDPGARAQRRSVFYGPDGEVEWETKDLLSPAPLGRDFVLARRAASKDSLPRLSVLQVPGGKQLATWPGAMGWGASSPLGNFLAVNSIGVFDSTLGSRQDELRLIDLEGTIVWTRPLTADSREFAVSNFGDVAIARDGELLALDRSGIEKMRTPLPRNSVGRTAMTPDGRFVLVATSSPLARRKGTGPWLALYDVRRNAPIWTRKTLNLDAAKGAEVTELSVADDASRVLLRLSTGAVLLLGGDGRRLMAWNLERVSRGEYEPGAVPRRTWLSADGTLVAVMMPVATSLGEARGWLYRVVR